MCLNITTHWGTDSFWGDFQNCLIIYWNDKKLKEHNFSAEDNDIIPDYTNIKFPPWESVEWMMNIFEKQGKAVTDNKVNEMCETNLEEHIHNWEKQKRTHNIFCVKRKLS
ncbi:MAG: hypothetical protein FWC12_11005 [Treponema sp.]|nr:hypothetical protein [Treponema sp.]